MKAVYRLQGCGGGDWKAVALLQNGSTVTPYTTTCERVSHPTEAREETAREILPFLLSHEPEELILYTDTEKPHSVVPHLSSDVKSAYDDTQLLIREQYNPQSTDEADDLWTVSQFLWFDGRYNGDPTVPPKPPYTVYTDASLWDADEDLSASVGFLVIGENGGTYSAGSPTPETIQDNNVAEYYAVLAALQALPDGSTVHIKTDSQNVSSIMNDHIADPSFPIIHNLRAALDRFDSPKIEYVSRNWTTVADALAEVGRARPLTVGTLPRLAKK